MGKRIIAQRRGSGSSLYRIPSHLYKYAVSYAPKDVMNKNLKGKVLDIIKSNAHSAPLLKVLILNKTYYLVAPEGISVGETLSLGPEDSSKPKRGDVLFLKDISEGNLIYNIESMPGDGGKFVRSSGSYARLISKTDTYALIEFPSKKLRRFPLSCRATIGIVAGAGRSEKPIFKAGNAFYKAKSKHKLYPKVSGSAMNAVDHPFGNKRTSRKAKKIPVSRGTPPGRKVGMIAAKRTGKKK